MYKFYTKKLEVPYGYIHKVMLIMRLTTVLLIVTIMQVSASSFAQRFTYKKNDATLREIFKEIKKQTGYNVVWTTNELPETKNIDMDFKNTPLGDVLKKSLSEFSLSYTIQEKTIVIQKHEKSILDKLINYFESIDISGFVVDEEGLPLLGASISVKGTNKYTMSNKDGSFKIKGVDQNAHVIFSFIGYKTKELRAADDFSPVRLELASSKLDEIQIQAYGQTSRRLNTGNIGTVNAADIEKQPVTNALLALQGRVAGLFVTQGSGLPNSTVQVKVRGTNTIGQQVDPLYVIDGLPYSSKMMLNVGSKGSGQASPLSFINPNTIASIDVLKDADATAIYGSRGANGVVLITTKKGKAGDTKFDVNIYAGISEIPRKLDLMNNDEFLAMRREAFANDDITPAPEDAIDLFTWDPNRNVNWQDRLIGKATLTKDAQVSMSGGTENTQYRVFGGYNTVVPPFPGSFKSEKISGGISLSTASTNKRFHAQVGVNYLSDQTFLPAYDPTENLRLAPNAPEPFKPDGSLNFMDFAYSNPFRGFKNWYKGKTNNLITNAALSYNISSALTFRVSGGYNTSSVYGLAVNTIAEKAGNPLYANPTGTAQFSYNTITSWATEPQLSYQGFFLKGKWEALVGTTFQGTRTNGQLITGNGYTNDALLNSLAGSSSVSNNGSTYEQSKFASLYGRINYNYEDKYLLNFTGRRDGSSRFGPNRKFGNFGAAGMAWIFSKENFISQNLPFLSFGKLRASYGITGNEPGSNYKYLPLNSFLTPSRPYQNSTAIAPDNLLAPDYAWEEVKKMEGGLELGFLKDRILTSASYFRNVSDNQLVNYSLPAITGFNSVLINRNATVQNTGIEFTLSTTNIKSPDFSWKSDFNITIAKNKLLAFPSIENTPYAYSLFVGEALSTLPYYRSAGVDPETGIYQFYTKDGALTFTPDYLLDATEHVTFDPKYYGGVQNSITYKQFSLDIFFQFVKQKGNNYIFFNASDPAGVSFQGNNNQPKELLKRWQKKGDIAPYQRYTSSYGAASDALAFQQYSNASVTDASYIRLKNVSLSYELPSVLSQKLNIDRARFYFQAQNLYTFTKYKGLDPESQTYLPPLSVWTIGAQFTF